MSAVFWNLAIAILVAGMATAGPSAGGDWWLMMTLLAAAGAGLVAGHAVIGRVSSRSFGLLATGAAILAGGRMLPSSNALAIAAAVLAALVWTTTRRRPAGTHPAEKGRAWCPACGRPTLTGVGGSRRAGWIRTACPACETALQTGWTAYTGLLPLATALVVAPLPENRLLTAALLVAGLVAAGVTRLVWPDWAPVADQRSH